MKPQTTKPRQVPDRQQASTLRYIFWQDEDMWLGYLEDYPDYQTQGASIGELEENLRDIRHELVSGAIPAVRRRAELVLK